MRGVQVLQVSWWIGRRHLQNPVVLHFPGLAAIDDEFLDGDEAGCRAEQDDGKVPDAFGLAPPRPAAAMRLPVVPVVGVSGNMSGRSVFPGVSEGLRRQVRLTAIPAAWSWNEKESGTGDPFDFRRL